MKKGVILTGHGIFAKGLASSIKMVAGDFDNLRVCDFEEKDTYESLDKKILEAYESLKSYENVIILTDLLGATPFYRANICLRDKDNVHFFSGANFEMVYQALSLLDDDLDSYLEKLTSYAKDSIVYYGK
ncbi:MAG: PTS sugar transporter subunit IIA [Anaerococcus sp.]|nr:PTS sugar transporter subunit IIA [Anaerococcus sp.]